MAPTKVKIALVQMEVRGGQQTWNMDHAVELILEAASQGADLALLPECADLGWTHPSSRVLAAGIPEGRPCKKLASAARENLIYVCCGLTEKYGDDVYNSAVLIDKDGTVLCQHRKLNELDIGHAYYALGDRLNVCQTEFGTIGLMICADGFADDRVLARSLCYMGADIILSPCAWAVPGDHDNVRDPYGDVWRSSYIPVAREFSTAILGVSNVGEIDAGPWSGKKCIGCSLAIGPSGDEILQGPYGVDAESILYAEIQPIPRPARGTGWVERWKQMDRGPVGRGGTD